MTEKKKQKEGAYASLTGFKRAVPIILVALAVFTALCFITQNTGALGRAISNVLLGLFSIGGYFIPFLLLIHAFFYPSDVQKKRCISRLIFSVIAIIAISSMAHAITYFGVEHPFSAKEFYTSGVNSKGGGFIGGLFAFLLVKVFGSIGVIILAVLVFALYITYFFDVGKSAVSRVLLKILNAISDFFTEVKTKREQSKEKKAKKDEEKKREALASKQEGLFDDEFFDADNGLSDLTIDKLGIKESRDEKEIERRPSLQDKIIHEKNREIKSKTSEKQTYHSAEDKPARRQVNLDYSTTDSAHGLALSVEDSNFVPRENDIIYEEHEIPVQNKTVLEESAEDVFSRLFDPFDVKLNQELASRPSSKTSRERSEKPGISEITEPINEISEDDIQKARQRADFEMKKKAAIEAQERYRQAQKDLENTKTAVEFETVNEKSQEEPSPYIPSYMSKKRAEEIFSAIAEERPYYRQEESTDKQEEPSSEQKTIDYKQVSPVYSQERPVYAQQEHITEEYKPQEVYSSASDAESSYASATSGIQNVENITDLPRENTEDTFKPYNPPKTEDLDINASINKQEPDEANVLKVTRTMLDPTPTEPEKYKEAEYGYESDDAHFDTFETEPDEDEEETVSWMPKEENTDDIYTDDEIPEEEQSSEVKKFRQMFPFLDEDQKTSERTESSTAKDEEEDDIPFNHTSKQKEPEAKTEAPAAPQKPDYSDYVFPSVELLAKGRIEEDATQEEEKNANADKLVDTLSQFGVRVSIKGIDRGPRITRYEIVPARGVKVNSVTNLFNDIALNLGAEGIRMEAPIPGKTAIGVEIPNKKASTVLLRDLVESDEFIRGESKTLSCLGKDVTGNPVFADIAKMPHVLIAGATGMGKSVCINAILISILYKAKPDEVKFIMIDPKKVEFNGYNGIPHLLVPVVTDVKQAAGALMWAVEQMEKRYDLMEALEVRKLDAYNEKVRENPALGEPLPKIVIVIDELNDIMLQVRKPAEDLIMSIAQKARAAGIHLIIGTQRPSVDVITGVIKANIPSRISCKVASYNDSKTILEQAGAEKLLNNGDMLYIPAGAPKALRVQGAFVSDGEVAAVMKFLKSQAKGDIYDAQALEDINRAAQKCSKGGKGGDDFDGDDDDGDDLGFLNDQQFFDAVEIAIRSNKVSTSLLQRKIKIGYGKAAKYIDTMEEMGIVSEPNGQKPRDVLITKDEWHEMLSRRSLD